MRNWLRPPKAGSNGNYRVWCTRQRCQCDGDNADEIPLVLNGRVATCLHACWYQASSIDDAQFCVLDDGTLPWSMIIQLQKLPDRGSEAIRWRYHRPQFVCKQADMCIPCLHLSTCATWARCLRHIRSYRLWVLRMPLFECCPITGLMAILVTGTIAILTNCTPRQKLMVR